MAYTGIQSVKMQLKKQQ